MCTGKRQTHIRNAPSSRTAVTGIGPCYNIKKAPLGLKGPIPLSGGNGP